jgi:Cu/Ag efflux protein CusF
MRLARLVLAGSMLAVIGSVALAEEAQTGTVTTIDRISGIITIQQPQSGTVGSAAGEVTKQFRVNDSLLEKVHAGDQVKFTVSEAGGKKAITKIERQ